MKTDFNVEVHVDLGVTPELVALVESIIGKRQMPTVKEPSASEQQSEAVTAEQPTVKETEQPTDQAAPKPEAPKSETPKKPKELTEQDIREAMHKTRQRIEGENYKDETDGENYKKYHRQLTAQFKNIAALLGADKPSALPVEQRASFIAQCDELTVLEDGTIGTVAPY